MKEIKIPIILLKLSNSSFMKKLDRAATNKGYIPNKIEANEDGIVCSAQYTSENGMLYENNPNKM